ncbi:AAA family ATPase [Streptomyces sp. NRRL S-118]|uniref:AAA family ATPase n=1 Tax=Streptomyces sp. NRRL S-118 TaxID=1463881 RepID=UPI0004CC2351|nr:AAA family ATPase [Streptomyces sp. NRRL S-118]
MRWERPVDGREPAAAALLGWLVDPHAPGLCLVSGSAGCGKSVLLAWLVHHGTQEGTSAERRVHAVVPSAGDSLQSTVWALANQLGVTASTVEHLAAALGADARRAVIVLPDCHADSAVELVLSLTQLAHVRLIVESRTASPAHRYLSRTACAEMDLDLDQWRDRDRYELWRASQVEAPAPVLPASDSPQIDFSDPVAVCSADPWTVTEAYETDEQDHGGLRSAWLQAGQSLCQEQSPAARALTLASVLGDRADPRLAPALADLVKHAPWRLEWSRVRGDLTPPWPGPAMALATGAGPLAGCLLVADYQGTVRVVSMSDATTRGRMATVSGRFRSVAVMANGTVLLLDQSGRVRADTTRAAQPAKSGLAALLEAGPTNVERLVADLGQHTATALATITGPATGFVITGTGNGMVNVHGDASDATSLHEGTVTAVAGLLLPVDGEAAMPIIYSGGADGTVRTWSPGHPPMAVPVLQRPIPVVSLDAATTADGPAVAVAWSDGTVNLIHWETGTQRTFRPGRRVHSVALTEDSRLFAGTDQSLTCLSPHPAT